MTDEPKDNKCEECGTPVEATVAKKSYQEYQGVFCRKCRDALDAAREAGIINGPDTHEQRTPEQHDAADEMNEALEQTFNVAGVEDTVEVLNVSAPSAPPEETKPEPPKQNTESIITTIRGYVGNDVLQVFGPTGSGKSKFALECARQALAEGKKVFYLDTERNLTDEDIKSLKGCDYKYTPVLEEIDKICQTLPKCDLVIIDSIGFPILTAYARYSLKQKGDALLKLIAIFGDLKQWAYKNNGLAIVTNQPESDFNKAPDHIIRPFGDKSQFACKEIWRTDVVRLGATTRSKIAAFRSRSMGHKTIIAHMEISDSGVSITKVIK